MVKSKLLHPSQLLRRYISVALSRRLPVADVISYPALWGPDFPHADTLRRDRARPSGEATLLFYHKNAGLSIESSNFDL